MATCRSCGAQNSNDSKFCFACGAPLSSAPQNNAPQMGYGYNNAYAQANGGMNGQSSYAPAPATVKGCFASAWEDVRSSKGWVGKSFLLGLIYLIPILNFVVAGYAMRWGRKAMFGNREPLPKEIFADNSFVTGFYWCVLSLVFGIVTCFASFLLAFVPFIGLLAIIAFLIFGSMFIYACGMRIALSGRLEAGFNFSTVWPAYKKGLGSLFCASMLPSIVIGLIVAVVESIIAFIAFIVLGVSVAPLISSSYYYSSSQAIISALAPSIIPLTILFLVLIYFALVATSAVELISWRAMGYWAARNASEWLSDPAMVSAFSAAPANSYGYPAQGGYGGNQGGSPYQAAPAQGFISVDRTPVNQFGNNVSAANAGQYGGEGQYGGVGQNNAANSYGFSDNRTTDSPFATPSDDRETIVLSSAQNEEDRPTTVLGGGSSVLKLKRSNGEVLTISDFPATIGKGSAASIQLSGNNAVSRVHARIVRSNNTFAIEDLASTNGTSLNGSTLADGEVAALHDGDVLTFGDENLTVRI